MGKGRGRTWGLAITLVAVFVPAATPVVGQEPLRVLFVGNSYTYYNNLPHVLAEMASGVPGAAPVVAGRVTSGGATLADLWRGGDAVDSIRTGRWDIVVLQEQSLLGGIRVDGEPVLGEPDSLRMYARLFRDEVEARGAETLLLLTWAREGAPEQQAGLDHAYVSVARELGLRIVPVGRVWARVREALPEAGLYSPDGSHPAPRGTWLAAATTVATVVGEHALETLPGSIRADSLDGRGEAVPGRVSRLEVPAAFVRVVGRAVREELAGLRAAGGYPATAPPERRPLPDVPPAMAPGRGELTGAWSGALTMQVPGTLRLVVRSVEDDAPAGDVLVTLGSSEFESSLEGAQLADGVLSGEVVIGMGGAVRYRLAYRGDALVGVAELDMGRPVAVSSVRLEREDGTAAAAPFPDCEGHDPSWSPDGRWIVFTSDCQGNLEIYRMGSDGSGPTRLTRTPGAEHTPRWSPDGARIAYAYAEEGARSEIVVMAADGSGATALTANETTEWNPTWSPDGSRIAYESHRDGNADVYLLALSTGAERRLTRSPARDVSPAWSPDGSLVAFQTDREGRYTIHGVDPDGPRAPRALVVLEGQAVTPAWSPDGEQIVVAHEPAPGEGTELAVVRPGGTAAEPLTRNERVDFAPSWSPDGRRIVFMGRSGETGVVDPCRGRRRLERGQARRPTLTSGYRGELPSRCTGPRRPAGRHVARR